MRTSDYARRVWRKHWRTEWRYGSPFSCTDHICRDCTLSLACTGNRNSGSRRAFSCIVNRNDGIRNRIQVYRQNHRLHVVLFFISVSASVFLAYTTMEVKEAWWKQRLRRKNKKTLAFILRSVFSTYTETEHPFRLFCFQYFFLLKHQKYIIIIIIIINVLIMAVWYFWMPDFTCARHQGVAT